MSADVVRFVRNRGNREDSTVPENNEERWTSPRIVLTLIQLFIGFLGLCVSALSLMVVVGGMVLGAYLLSQKNDVTSEMSNVQLAQQIGTLSAKFDKFTDTQTLAAQTSAREMTEVKSDVATLRRDLDNEAKSRESRDGWLEARIVSGK